MDHSQEKHPLDDEEFAVVVSLIHSATGVRAEASAGSPTGMPAKEAIKQATDSAMDQMLAQLEIIGG